MQQANAQGVRGRKPDSVLRRLTSKLSHRTDGQTNKGQSAVEADVPAWPSQLNQFALGATEGLRSETFLRRLLPVLVVSLLLLVAFVRAMSLLSLAQDIEQSSKRDLVQSAELRAFKLQANKALVDALTQDTLDTKLAELLLEDSVGTFPDAGGRGYYLFDANNRLIASLPSQPTLEGVTLNRITGGDRGLVTQAVAAGARTILFDGVTDSFAAFRPVTTSPSLGADQTGQIPALAGLLVVQEKSALFSSWRQTARVNAILFIATSIISLLFLWVYFNQASRAREADLLFAESSSRFDTALSRGHCGLWDWDLARGRVVWSRSMYEMVGLQPSEGVIGFAQLSALMHPDDKDFIQLADELFTSKKKQIDHRFRLMHSSGSWMWLRIRAELVPYKGTDPHLIGIAVDITEQEALKQRSRRADIRLRDAIENISEAFVLWDSKKRLVMCNSKYQQLYNLPTESVASGSSYDAVLSASRKPRILTPVIEEKRADRGTKTFEAQIEDGRWLQISERRTQDGGFVSVGTDITQIKRNEEKLVDSERRQQRTIDDLQTTQRQLEMQAQQLVEFADNLNEQKKKADAGNKAKSEFLANISHELRTPLNAIIGFSDIMRTRMFGPLGSEKYTEYADDIHHSGSFLLNVINDVLDMSKIEAGRFALRPEQLNVSDLLSDTLRIIHKQAEDAQIKVTHSIPDDLVLEADRRAIKQILLNLLSNAVKFTGADGQISVTARVRNQCVSIAIADNGIGISVEAMRRLGRPFEQVQDQFTKDHKGTGLGLAIARSLSKLHGGKLRIRSELGEGTIIVVRLPMVQPKSDTAQENVEAETVKAEPELV
ncbi:MAG: ATP-binding protein [Pseudomonadota bacterium]